jgi:hypothetical protein
VASREPTIGGTLAASKSDVSSHMTCSFIATTSVAQFLSAAIYVLYTCIRMIYTPLPVAQLLSAAASLSLCPGGLFSSFALLLLPLAEDAPPAPPRPRGPRSCVCVCVCLSYVYTCVSQRWQTRSEIHVHTSSSSRLNCLEHMLEQAENKMEDV